MTGASSLNVVRFRADTSAIEAALADFEALRSSAPESVSEHLASLSEIVGELFRVRSENRAAAGAFETVVLLEPSDGFLRLLAALRAGDFDLLTGDGLLNVIRHDSVSVGSVGTANEGQLPGESQGSSGSDARNAQGRVN